MKNKIIIYITTAIILLFVGILIPTNNIYAMFTPGGGVGFSNGTKNSSSSSSTPDDVMKDADDFIKQGENTADIDTDKLHDTSNFLYNLLLAFGIVVAVIVGMVIGIMYMVGSVEEKANMKKALIGYALGCFVVFGAFGIWRLSINILSNV